MQSCRVQKPLRSEKIIGYFYWTVIVLILVVKILSICHPKKNPPKLANVFSLFFSFLNTKINAVENILGSIKPVPWKFLNTHMEGCFYVYLTCSM